MRSKEIRSIPTVSGLTSRREILRRGAIVAAVSAIAPVWTRRAHAQTAAAPFDYYISTNGSDSNPGTLAAPWAITSLTRTSSNRSKIAGARIGLLPGTYAIYSLWSTGLAGSNSTGTYAYNSPVLALPSGTSGKRTFLGASDSSGNQTIGSNPGSTTHAITASPSGRPGGGLPGTYSGGMSSQSIAIAGFDCRDSNSANTAGHVQIDGIAISDSTNLIVSFYGNASAGGSSGRITDCWLTNCHIYNCGGNEGNNTGAVWFGGGADNGGVQNCIIHDCQIPWPPTTGSGTLHNCAGIFSEASLNELYEYNTIYNCNCGIYDKNYENGGNTYRYNYIEVNGIAPYNCMIDCAGGPAGSTARVYNNIFVIAPSTTNERFIWQGMCTNGPGNNPDQAMQFYNNTCYVLSGGGFQSGVTYQSAGTGSVKHYNNIYVSAAPGYYDTVSFNSASSAVAISDYNAYIGGCGADLGRGTDSAPSANYALANWQSSFSLDTHSIAQASESGVFTSPGGAQNPSGYKLASGSVCKSAGRSGGTASGAIVDMGAWGGTDVNTGGAITRIGANLGAPVGSTASPPDAPVLSVS